MSLARDLNHYQGVENPYDQLYIYYLEGSLPSSINPKSPFVGNWEEDGFSFLFFTESSDDVVADILSSAPEMTLIDRYEMSYEDWQGGKVKPFQIERFVIYPPWEDPGFLIRAMKGSIHIILDPGVVFGTGTHSTTSDCLKLLDKAFKEKIPDTLLDIGTGTGLLALASAKLGCPRTMAIDFNYLAARTTGRNIKLNGLENKVMAAQGLGEDFIHRPCDFLVANIHYDVMRHLLESPGFLKTDRFILSGLLKSQAALVEAQLSKLPVNITDRRETDGVWHTFAGTVITGS